MDDSYKLLADDIRAMTMEHCAKIAEIHIRPERGELDRGYNKAVREIAGKIRELIKRGATADAA